MKGAYDDIINLPHPVSTKYPQMPIANRAAQFSPFAALTGYDAALQETARETTSQKELDENAIETIDMKLRILADETAQHPEIAVTYFQPDKKKKGGAYATATGALKKIDNCARVILLMDGVKISFEDIVEIDCERFDAWALETK